MRSLGEVVRKISLLPAFESGGKCGPSPDQSRGAQVQLRVEQAALALCFRFLQPAGVGDAPQR